MHFKLHLITTIFSLILFLQPTHNQCPTNHSLITVYYYSTPIEVCIPSYSVIKHCLIYWTPTMIQTYSTPQRFECRRCGVYINEEFIVSLAMLATSSSKYYLSCIPNSLKTINCEYYIEKVFEDKTVTFECGNCPTRYPTMVKGVVNQYSFCVDKPVSNCLRYGQNGLDRIGFTKVKCDSCEARYVLDFATNKCLQTIDNCVSYDQFRKCTKCNTGFTLNNQQCTKPDQSFSQLSSQQQTQPKPVSNQSPQPPCLQFSRRSLDICMKCKQNYTLWNGQCLICPDGSYVNSKGQCVNGQFPNCGKFSQEGLCLYCKESFKFNNDLTQCVSVIPTKKCPENTSRVNHVLMNNVCVAVDVNCQQNSFGINGCFDCKPGFYIWEGVCYFYR